MDINKKEKRIILERINGTKSWFFEKMNDKSLARPTKKKLEKSQVKEGVIAINLIEIKMYKRLKGKIVHSKLITQMKWTNSQEDTTTKTDSKRNKISYPSKPVSNKEIELIIQNLPRADNFLGELYQHLKRI